MQRTTKITIVFILLFVSAFQLKAQVEVEESPRNERMDYMLMEFGWATFINKPESVEYRWYNYNFNIALFYDVPFGQSGISGAFGLAFSTQSYYSNSQVRRDTSLDYDYSIWQHVDGEYRNNKTALNWLGIPIELRFRSKEDQYGNRIKVAVGVKASYLLGVSDKFVDKSRVKFKTFYFPDVRNYQIGGIFRIGYGKMSVSAYYGLTGFFVPNRGRDMHQFTLSFALTAF